MDIEIDIECRHCGYVYRDGFKAMQHGRALKCPMCCSAQLHLKGDALIERDPAMDGFDWPSRTGLAESKFKL